MKQELLCPSCADDIRASFSTNQPYPGEGVFFAVGRVKPNLNRVCDHCNKSLPDSSICIAFSAWGSTQNKYDWESEFLAPLRGSLLLELKPGETLLEVLL